MVGLTNSWLICQRTESAINIRQREKQCRRKNPRLQRRPDFKIKLPIKAKKKGSDSHFVIFAAFITQRSGV